MKINVFFNPIFHIIIENFFDKKINKGILRETIENKKEFNPSRIGAGVTPKFRSNSVSYYDELYIDRRDESFLLTSLAEKFRSTSFKELLSTSPFPISDFTFTTYHETQVSRYGSKKQKYNWHVDRLNNLQRQLTLVYYFNSEPKKFTGGTIQITNSPVVDGKTVMKKPQIKSIVPKNNMAIIFSAITPHRVLDTTSSKKFADGRFSVNCWIGFK